jgi:adenosylcobyric acid synthase
MANLAPVLMVQGTASSVGKSTLVAGLCRLFARRGIRVAPFKAQNMSNNAAVCPDGGEIGRAQFAQAVAAGIAPSVDMNPILLKPQGGTSQVIVRGQMHGAESAADYWRAERRQALWPLVAESLDRLRSTYELVVAEGAGSPAEINLRDRDLVNMQVALYAHAEVLLVADIDRGGAFASLLGTWQWLTDAERALVRGFILNKFRGDAGLLAPAPELLEERTGVPVIGLVPYLADLRLPEEDAASLVERPSSAAFIEVAVIRFPHLANFDEFGPLSDEPGVQLRFVARAEELRAPDLVILPGTKATIPDLLWLRQRGLGERVCWLARHDTPVLGICGGYQMLGSAIHDPLGIESEQRFAEGLGLLPVETELSADKRLVNTHGRALGDGQGVWQVLGNTSVEGYEIHVGRTRETAPHLRFLALEAGPDGSVSMDLPVAGTHLHGLLESRAPREALLTALAQARGFPWQPASGATDDAYDRLADVLETALRLSTLSLREARSSPETHGPPATANPLTE